MGLPLPGETILVLAAIYAATEPSFNVWVVIAVAAFGAIVGDNAGYWLGLRYGYALLGRFVALLRILAAFLAGVNRMPLRAFLIANASGGIIGGYFFGKLLPQLHHPLPPLQFPL